MSHILLATGYAKSQERAPRPAHLLPGGIPSTWRYGLKIPSTWRHGLKTNSKSSQREKDFSPRISEALGYGSKRSSDWEENKVQGLHLFSICERKLYKVLAPSWKPDYYFLFKEIFGSFTVRNWYYMRKFKDRRFKSLLMHIFLRWCCNDV